MTKPLQRGNLKQQAAAERLHNAINEFYLSVIEQVEASQPGKDPDKGITALDIIQSYNIFMQSVVNMLEGWNAFWAQTLGAHTVDASPEKNRTAFKDALDLK